MTIAQVPPFCVLLQAAALRFINTVVQTAQGPNAKVFHQHEFKEAGFSPAGIEKVCIVKCIHHCMDKQ